MLYLAYGSNCSEDRMKSRKADYSIRCQGILRDHKLVFNKKATVSSATNTDDSYYPTCLHTDITMIGTMGNGITNIKKKAIYREAEEGYSSIVASKGDVVYGALHVLDPEGIKKLDVCEGTSGNHYTREIRKVELENGVEVDAIVYVAHKSKIEENLKPSQVYLNHILKGKDLMPTDYYEKLEKTPVIKVAGSSTPIVHTNQHGHGQQNSHHTKIIKGVRQQWGKNRAGAWGWSPLAAG